MVGLMSYGKRQFEALESVMRKLIPPFHQAMNEMIVIVDTDALAFSSYMVSGMCNLCSSHPLLSLCPFP